MTVERQAGQIEQLSPNAGAGLARPGCLEAAVDAGSLTRVFRPYFVLMSSSFRPALGESLNTASFVIYVRRQNCAPALTIGEFLDHEGKNKNVSRRM